MSSLTPPQIVAELDQYIVGQAEAKRAVAVALRNRDRRRRLPPELRDEVTPKNILMIGPTGVGKTEIARRVARLIEAPFVKVEATKFTEVGYVGRDVESMVRDLLEASIAMSHAAKLAEVRDEAEQAAEQRLLSYLADQSSHRAARALRRTVAAVTAEQTVAAPATPAVAVVAGGRGEARAHERRLNRQRRRLAQLVAAHVLDDEMIEIDLEPDDEWSSAAMIELVTDTGGSGTQDQLQELVETLATTAPPRRRRRVSVREARQILTEHEASRRVDADAVVEAAIERTEQTGVIFIDELDKIVGSGSEYGADVSREGVQRDLLPIIEGSTVITRYGPVKTDHILFIAAGAFEQSKPGDLIPELQGRFPLRVELADLTEDDLFAILTQPRNALTRQYAALLATEGVHLTFTEDGLHAIARHAAHVNRQTEDIGARRLHTIVEKVLEEVSFDAAEHAGATITIDAAYVDARVAAIVADEDLSNFIL